jgi:hypothetical protein
MICVQNSRNSLTINGGEFIDNINDYQILKKDICRVLLLVLSCLQHDTFEALQCLSINTPASRSFSTVEVCCSTQHLEWARGNSALLPRHHLQRHGEM